MKNTWWIGRECKHSNVLSGPVLIGRGLDQKRDRKTDGSSPSNEDSHVYARKYYIVLNVQNFGGNNGKDTPVPIPNTAVKLPGADDTWMETSRKNKSLPDYIPQ